VHHLGNDTLMNERIFDDTAGAVCLGATCLELGFHQDNDISIIHGQMQNGGDCRSGRDERQINDDEIGNINRETIDITDVDPGKDLDSFVTEQPLMQQILTYIHRKYATCPLLQYTIGETTRGRSEICNRPPSHIKVPCLQSVIELFTAP
jgi:hypothetical protein